MIFYFVKAVMGSIKLHTKDTTYFETKFDLIARSGFKLWVNFWYA